MSSDALPNFNSSQKDYDLCPEIHPIDMASGQGGRLIDTQGREFIDCLSAWGANILGYGYPRVAQAIESQAKKYTSLGLPDPVFLELSKQLCQVIPCAEKVRFGKNGSDATLGAVRLARAITGRWRILHRGYHGFHDWWMAATDCRGIPPQIKDLIITIEDLQPESLNRMFKKYPGEIACLIFNVGLNPLFDRKGILEVMEIVHRHGALIIFDEIGTGFRLSPSGMQEIWNVAPDLACYGKAVANGMPLSVLAGKAKYMDHISTIGYGMTFEAEAVSAAASLATLAELQEKNVCQEVARKGERLRKRFHSLAQQLHIKVQLTGPPALLKLEFETQSSLSARHLHWLFIQEMVRRGIYMLGSILLCYSHTDEDLETIERSFEESLQVVKEAIATGTVEGLLDLRVFNKLI